MILVSFFSEDNVLSDEIKICYILEYQSNKNLVFCFFWDTRYSFRKGQLLFCWVYSKQSNSVCKILWLMKSIHYFRFMDARSHTRCIFIFYFSSLSSLACLAEKNTPQGKLSQHGVWAVHLGDCFVDILSLFPRHIFVITRPTTVTRIFL